jgi:hypothetical protein
MVEKKSKEKCGCMPWMGIVALVFSVVGIYSIILGIKFQFLMPQIFNNWYAMLCYLGGIILMAIAKIGQHHAYCKCEKHRI